MFESCLYPKVTAHAAGSAVQKLSRGGHGRGFDGTGVARLGAEKTSGRLMQQRKANDVVDVLLAREQRGRADKATGRAKQCSAWKLLMCVEMASKVESVPRLSRQVV